MKIFGLRNLVGLAAIGGAAYYVKKQGGLKNAIEQLMKKRDEVVDFIGKQRDEVAKAAAPANGAKRTPAFERH